MFLQNILNETQPPTTHALSAQSGERAAARAYAVLGSVYGRMLLAMNLQQLKHLSVQMHAARPVTGYGRNTSRAPRRP